MQEVAGAAVSRRTAGTLAGLLAFGALGWALTVREAGMDDDMATTPAAFIGAWIAMMAAMMLPSAAPFVLLYSARGTRPLATAILVTGYLGVWAAFGAVAYGAHRGIDAVGMGTAHGYVVAAILAAAGVYQLTPLKTVCLKHCRSPVAFLMEHWRGGRFGGLRLGVDHGLYCLGCCWALMVVLVVAGAMSLVWATAIALSVFIEKVAPLGSAWAKISGFALIAVAIAVALDPDLAMALST